MEALPVVREKKLTIRFLSLFLILYPIIEGYSNAHIPVGTKYLGFALAAVWLIDLLMHKKVRISGKVAIFSLYLLWGIWSIQWSVYPPASVARAMGYVQALILYYVIFDVVKTRPTLVKMIRSYVIGIAILSATAFYNVVTHNSEGYGDRFTAMGQDPNYFGVTVVTIIPLMYFLYSETKHKRYLLGIIVAVPLAMATSSRGAFLALAVVAIGYVFLFLKSFKKTVVMLGLFGSLMLLINWIVPQEALKRLSDSASDTTGSGRTEIWDQAWKIGASHPLTGRGAGSFPYLSIDGMFAHNTFLSNWAELGVVGFGLWLILWVLHFRSIQKVKSFDGNDSTLRFSLLFTMFAVLIGALTLNWEIQKSVFIIWAFSSVLHSCLNVKIAEVKSGFRSPVKRIVVT